MNGQAMADAGALKTAFRAAPVTDYLMLLSEDRPEDAPGTYQTTQQGDFWLAADGKLPLVPVVDSNGRRAGLLIGFVYSEFVERFLPAGEMRAPVVLETFGQIEEELLPRLSGMFVFLSDLGQTPRLYMDHGGSFPIVYSAEERRIASTTALLMDEASYEARFRADLHDALIGEEGAGGWISGSLTAHRGVRRLLPNHYLDLGTWEVRRFWPKPGEFETWRDFDRSVAQAAAALDRFSFAANQTFDVAATTTAGFDSRLLVAACRTSLDRCRFFTLEVPGADLDVDVSRDLATKFGLRHRTLPLRDASEYEMRIWDRMVGDCMVEAPRRTHTTLRDLTDRNAMFTGMYGEVGRCRLYRQDFERINQSKIDARFVLDRLTLPPHAELLASIEEWFAGLQGQPNSVILDLAFLELKFGSWAMGQRPITNSIKLNFMPFSQRAVFNAFIGVEPARKGTETLFWAIIGKLWPELSSVPINKYGDARDYLTVWKKLSNPMRVRRFLRDRFARKSG